MNEPSVTWQIKGQVGPNKPLPGEKMNKGVYEQLEKASEMADGFYYIAHFSYYGMPTMKLLFLPDSRHAEFPRDIEIVIQGSIDINFIVSEMMNDAQKRRKQAIQDHWDKSLMELYRAERH